MLYFSTFVSVVDISCSSSCLNDTVVDNVGGKLSGYFCTAPLSITDLNNYVTNITNDLNAKHSCPIGKSDPSSITRLV